MKRDLCHVFTINTDISLCTMSRFFPFSKSVNVQTIDGWMICDFTSFSTVFQSYQDDGRMIMKGLCNGTPFTVEKGLELATARSVGQRLTP